MKKALSIFCLISLLISFILLPFFTEERKVELSKNDYKAILRIWHIDTFEGGTGSRASFLKSVSTKYTKKHSGVLFLVSNFTEETAKAKIENGELPDLISFGACSINVFNKLVCLQTTSVKDGGEYAGKRYLSAWCKGGYFLIKKSESSEEKLIISQGQNNLSTVSACIEKLTAKTVEIKEPLEAYSSFLSSSNACLLGTQRDIVRLNSKGVSFTATPLTKFSDLYQYIGVTSTNETKRFYALSFIDFLLSESVQKTLVNVKMLSPNVKGLYSENEHFTALENASATYTISPFLLKSEINDIKNKAKEQILSQNFNDDLLKFLKQL